MTMTPPKEAERILRFREASGDAEEVGVEQTEVGRLGGRYIGPNGCENVEAQPRQTAGCPGFRAATAVAGERLRRAPANALCLCGKGFKEVASDSHAYTGFIRWILSGAIPKPLGFGSPIPNISTTRHVVNVDI